MIPVRDDVPCRRTPWVTYALIAANVAVFVHEILLPGPALSRLVAERGLVPVVVAEAFRHDPFYVLSTFVTYQFLHAGYAHVGGNMLYLWIFGDNVEDRLGPIGFLLFYVGCGAAAGALQVAADPYSPVPCVGASGAVAGVLGAYFVTYPLARVVVVVPFFVFFDVVYVPALFFLGLWFLIQFLQGIGAAASAVTGVAWWAHVGGFVAGAIAMRRANMRRRRR